jgi:polyferredoxin
MVQEDKKRISEKDQRGSEMKKTPVYWTGLVFVGLSVWALLFDLWGLMTMRGPISGGAFFPFAVFTTIGAVIFILIGALMMKEGREA